MLVLTFLKPQFATKTNINIVKSHYFTKVNKCEVVAEFDGIYSAEDCTKHYAHLKSKPAIFEETFDYITSDGIYAMIIDYAGTEEEWKTDRLRIIGATKEVDLIPGCIRYDFTIGLGMHYNIGKNVMHSSDSRLAATKEIMIALNVLLRSAEQEIISKDRFNEIVAKLIDANAKELQQIYIERKNVKKTDKDKIYDLDVLIKAKKELAYKLVDIIESVYSVD